MLFWYEALGPHHPHTCLHALLHFSSLRNSSRISQDQASEMVYKNYPRAICEKFAGRSLLLSNAPGVTSASSRFKPEVAALSQMTNVSHTLVSVALLRSSSPNPLFLSFLT